MSHVRKGTLVVGAGHAGLSFVTALRELGDTEPITLVGSEPGPPYDRPPLTKGLLLGTETADDIVLRPREWFAEHGIELVTGEEVVRVARDASGGEATTATGRVIGFERLALATGASSRGAGLPGENLDGVVTVRELDDARLLRDRLLAARRVVVVGGGFIGLEVAAGARSLGADVTVVEVAERLLPRSVTPVTAAALLAAHESRGVRVLLGRRVARLEGGSAGPTVVPDDGTELPSDLVVLAVGAAPRTGLARQLGLDVTGAGVVVDAHALASDGLTVAVGDCAVGPNPFDRGLPGPLRLESVQHATDHARVGAATLLGHRAAYRAVPWFWSDQGPLKLQMAGLTAGADATVVRGDPASEVFSVLAYREGLLIGAECLGSSADYLAVKRGLEKGLTIEPSAAADVSVPLKRSLTAVADAAGSAGTSTTTGS